MAKNKAQSNKSKSATLKEKKQPSKHNIYNPIKVKYNTYPNIYAAFIFEKQTDNWH